MARLSNNWAEGIRKPHDGMIKRDFSDTVYFRVFEGAKPYKIGIRADRVEMKTKDWDDKRIGYKRIEE